MQSVSHDNIFAAGDCASIERADGKPPPPKAGVFAVRAGPILIQNLPALIAGGALADYVPQEDFLKLLMTGDGEAIGFRFGFAMRGPWVWRLKDMIDRSFMDLFDPATLPDLEAEARKGKGYDTSQYDAQPQAPRLACAEAAALLDPRHLPHIYA